MVNSLFTGFLLLSTLLTPVRLPQAKDFILDFKENRELREQLELEEKHKEGIASWYGIEEQGKYVANYPERFNMYALTAAHNTLKFGTKVRVTNKLNGKSIVVRINDRGGFNNDNPKIKQKTKDRRDIDLSYAAAKRIGILDIGKAPVYIEALN